MFMQKMLGGALAAVTLAGSLVAFAPDASAQYYRDRDHRGRDNGGAVAAGVVGGLALGALAAGAANGGYGGGYGYGGPGYAAPAYGPGYRDCYITTQRAWDGYRYVVERVRVCE